MREGGTEGYRLNDFPKGKYQKPQNWVLDWFICTVKCVTLESWKTWGHCLCIRVLLHPPLCDSTPWPWAMLSRPGGSSQRTMIFKLLIQCQLLPAWEAERVGPFQSSLSSSDMQGRHFELILVLGAGRKMGLRCSQSGWITYSVTSSKCPYTRDR